MSGTFVNLGSLSRYNGEITAMSRNLVSYTGVLDLLTVSAVAAYSLRRTRGAYTGPSIRVRRNNDNAELDIGFTSAGTLDTVALLAFIGAFSGFVTTWYDQSGNSRTAVQVTNASQARIVNAGVVETTNGQPGVNFTVGGGYTLSGIAASSTLTFNAVASQNGSANSRTVWAGDTGSFQSRYNSGNIGIVRAQQAIIMSAVAANGLRVLTLTATASNSSIAVDGVVTTSATLVNATTPVTRFGSNVPPPSEQFLGVISEGFAFSSSLSTTNRQTLERNQGAFYGITVA